MTVYRRFDGHGLPTLVTSNLELRQPRFRSPIAATMLLDVMAEVRRETSFELTAWVVMPDHVHFVIRVPETMKLGRVMQLIKGRFAHRYNELNLRNGSIWQSRYHARVLQSQGALNAAIEYVHANPVVAGLVSSAEQFEWSSARHMDVPSG